MKKYLLILILLLSVMSCKTTKHDNCDAYSQVSNKKTTH
jgi:hypothetical protein